MRSRRNCSSHIDCEVLHVGSFIETHVVNSLIDKLAGCLRTTAIDSRPRVPLSSVEPGDGTGY